MGRKERNRELMGDTSGRDVSWSGAVGMALNKLAFFVTLMVAVTASLFVGGMWSVPACLLLLLSAALVPVWTQLATPGFWRRLRAIRRDPAPLLPDALDFHDPAVAAMVLRVKRARQAREQTIARSPYQRRQICGAWNASAAELERRALVTAARADYVRDFLVELSAGSNALEGEVARLRSEEQRARSDEASAEYQQAAAWSLRHEAAVRRLETRGAALMANLEHLAVALEAIPAKLTDVELLRIEEADHLIGADTSEAEDQLVQLN